MHGSLLDLLLCDDASSKKLHSVDVLSPLSPTCDHCIINFTFSYYQDINEFSNLLPFLQYHKGNYEKINAELAKFDFMTLFKTYDNDIQSIYDCFLHKVHSLMYQYIPMSKVKSKI